MLIEIRKRIKWFAIAAIDWVMASGKKSQGTSGFSVVGGGTGTDVVLFSTYGVPNMANTSYQVLVNGETASATHVDETTKTVLGFSILGGGSSEVMHVVVVGRFAGMPEN